MSERPGGLSYFEPDSPTCCLSLNLRTFGAERPGVDGPFCAQDHELNGDGGGVSPPVRAPAIPAG